MLGSLLDTHPRALLVLKRPQRERERSSLLLDLGEHSPGRLHLELVHNVRLLVDRRPRLLGPRLSVLGRGNENVDPVDLALLERLHVLD